MANKGKGRSTTLDEDVAGLVQEVVDLYLETEGVELSYPQAIGMMARRILPTLRQSAGQPVAQQRSKRAQSEQDQGGASDEEG